MKGGKHLIDRLEKIKKAISEDVPNVIDGLVNERRKAAEQGFATAQYDGENDVTVYSSHIQDSARHQWNITAEGTKVLFIEYGSGIFWKHDSGFGDASAYPPKSWSLGPNGKGWLSNEKIAKYHGWWRLPSPDGSRSAIFTNGNPSNNVMFNVSKQLHQDVESGRMMRPIKEAMK